MPSLTIPSFPDPPQPSQRQRRRNTSRRSNALRRRRERLANAAVSSGALSFMATFMTLDLFATLLAFIVLILIGTWSCGGHARPVNVLTACFLSFITSGVSVWNVVRIFIPDKCRMVAVEGSNTTASHSVDGMASINVTSLDSTTGDAMRNVSVSGPSTPLQLNNHDDEPFCSNREWILSFNIFASCLWLATGILLILQLRQFPLTMSSLAAASLSSSAQSRQNLEDGNGTVAETEIDDDVGIEDEECATIETIGESNTVAESNITATNQQ